MQESGLEKVAKLLDGGFYHRNLEEMAKACREKVISGNEITSFVLHTIFRELAFLVEDNPYESSIKNLESKYQEAISRVLDASDNQESKAKDRITELIRIYWDIA
ncbi:MAG: hypothetical protein U5R49_12065 [Deltaproteobacteria bacterium]|nr:hypothetical protein [Deltaproteobacteria bacterium]